MWYVYVLFSKKTGHWYIGSTRELRKRILRHNSGKNRSTKFGLPWKLIYCEVSLNKDDVRARERYLKSGMGRRYLKNRMKFFFAQGFTQVFDSEDFDGERSVEPSLRSSIPRSLRFEELEEVIRSNVKGLTWGRLDFYTYNSKKIDL